MSILFNVLIVAIIALIAYWWANQGLFSALLHFLCVVAAGAIALSLWEPITVNLMLRGGAFDDYAWGVCLVVVFVAALIGLRIACDKLAPDNVNFPMWVNYVFGGALGVGAGILTMGMFLIGAGFLQSSTEIVGFRGVARDAGSAAQPTTLNTLYPPVHEITEAFYGYLSVGAFAPDLFGYKPLRRTYPALADESIGLFRDSFSDGAGKVSIAPGGVKVERFVACPEYTIAKKGAGAFAVGLTFDRLAFDGGDTLTLGAAQARLLGAVPNTDTYGSPRVAYPAEWSQPSRSGSRLSKFVFDDMSHYVTNLPGAQTATVVLIFPSRELGVDPAPEFIQIKGLRFRLPRLEIIPEMVMRDFIATGGKTETTAIAADPNAPKARPDEIRIDPSIAPLIISANQLSGLERDASSGTLTEGTQEFRGNAGNSGGGHSFGVKGIYEPQGTRIVKVDVSRKQSSIDIWGDKLKARTEAGETAVPLLVDDQGRTYEAIGYIWTKPDATEITLNPSRGIGTVADLPQLPSAGTHILKLVFRVSDTAHIVSFRLDTVTVVNCDVDASKRTNE